MSTVLQLFALCISIEEISGFRANSKGIDYIYSRQSTEVLDDKFKFNREALSLAAWDFLHFFI